MAGCSTWGDANHTYFQIANLFLAFTYFVPNTLTGLLVLRFFLGTAGFFFAIWSGVIICAPDTLAWNLVFIFINYGHAGYMLYSRRAIHFMEEHEVLYAAMFEQLGVPRWQYKCVADCGEVMEMKKGHVYAHEDETDGEHITILTNGSIHVTKSGSLMHRLKPYEFLDSPEWIASTTGNMAAPVTFQVTLISDGCTVISWKRRDLLRALRKEPHLKNIFDSLIGQDVAKKLFKSQTTTKGNSAGNGNSLNGAAKGYGATQESIPAEVFNVNSERECLISKDEKEESFQMEVKYLK